MSVPYYDYKCDGCQAVVEIQHSIKESPEFHCETCGTTLSRLISAPYVICTGEPQTVQQLASRNREKMGRYEYESKQQELNSSHVDAPRQRVDTSLLSKGPEAIQRYIETGKK